MKLLPLLVIVLIACYSDNLPTPSEIPPTENIRGLWYSTNPLTPPSWVSYDSSHAIYVILREKESHTIEPNDPGPQVIWRDSSTQSNLHTEFLGVSTTGDSSYAIYEGDYDHGRFLVKHSRDSLVGTYVTAVSSQPCAFIRK